MTCFPHYIVTTLHGKIQGAIHSRRPRGSQSGREKRQDESFRAPEKSSWVPTLTELFPKIQADAGSWLGTKNALCYCAQSANSFSWVLFVSSYTTAIVLATLARFVRNFSSENLNACEIICNDSIQLAIITKTEIAKNGKKKTPPAKSLLVCLFSFFLYRNLACENRRFCSQSGRETFVFFYSA